MDEIKKINLTDSEEITPESDNSLMEDRVMEPVKKSRLIPTVVIAGVLLGLVGGFYLAQRKLLLSGRTSLLSSPTQELTATTTVKVGDVFGSADEKTFRDQAEGILKSGGIDGEGSHHLERGDNKSQWVYITSSVVDLDLIIGHRVSVWGETNQGKKAGWLMDVGRLKVLELNAAPATDKTEDQN